MHTNQSIIELDTSSNGFNRFESLLNILKNDFGDNRIYICTEIYKTRQEILHCINDVLNIVNDIIYDGSIELWIPNHNLWSDDEDNHYCKLIKFGGYEILSDGQKILDSDVIILKNEESIHTLEYFTYENINEFCEYIEEIFKFYRKDVSDVDDKAYEQAINKKLNQIIDNYWMNTIEFDYAEFYLNN